MSSNRFLDAIESSRSSSNAQSNSNSTSSASSSSSGNSFLSRVQSNRTTASTPTATKTNPLTKKYNQTEETLNLKNTTATAAEPTEEKTQTRLEAFNAHKEQAKKEGMGAITGAFKTWASDIFNFGNTVADYGKEKFGTVDNEFSQRWANQHYGYTGEQVKEKNAEIADNLYNKGSEEIETARKSGGEDNKVMSVATDLVTNATQMGLDIGAGALMGGASKVPLFIRSAGGAMREAKNDGATNGQQLAYGLTKGAIETLSEGLFDGLGGAYGKGLLDSKVARSGVGQAVKKLVGNSPVNQAILKLGGSILSEAGEEGFSSAVDPLAKLVYDNGQSIRDILNNENGAAEDYFKGIGYDALIGGLMGGFASSGKVFSADATAYNQLQTMLQEKSTLDGAEHFMAMPSSIDGASNPMAMPEINADRNGVQTELNRILAKDSKYSKTASDIIHNAAALEEYESLYGKVEGNSDTEKVRNLAAALYLTMNSGEVNMPQPTENTHPNAVPDAPQTLPGAEHPMSMPNALENAWNPMSMPIREGAEPTTSGQIGSIMQIRDMAKNGITYSNATEILDNPTLRMAFEDMYGVTLDSNRAKAKQQIVDIGKTVDVESRPIPTGEDLPSQPAQHLGTTPTNPLYGAHQGATTPYKTHNVVNSSVSENGAHESAYVPKHASNTQEATENTAFENPLYRMRNNENAVEPEAKPLPPIEMPTAETAQAPAVKKPAVENPLTKATQPKSTVETAPTENAQKTTQETIPNEAQQITQPTEEKQTETVKPKENATPTATTKANAQTEPTPAIMNAENGAAYAEAMKDPGERERTHQYTANEANDQSVEPELRDKIKETLRQYGVKTNKATVNKAVEIMATGTESAAKYIEGKLMSAKVDNKKMSPEDAPLAIMVANELTANGEVDRANAIMSDMAVELTSAGQFIQAVRILRNASNPTPQLLVDTVQKALDKVNKTMENKGLKYTAEMTAEEQQALANTDPKDTEAFQAQFKSIMQRVGAEMPATVMEKVREFRHINMLLNPRTIITNVAANVPTIAIRMMDDKISGALQDIAVKMGKLAPEEQTKTLGLANKEQRAVAKEVYNRMAAELTDDTGKYEYSDERTIFKTHNKNILGKEIRFGGLIPQAIENVAKFALTDGDNVKLDKSSMEYLRRATYSLLEKGDVPFVRSAFIDSLANYMKAHDITSIDGVTDEAIAYATAAADYYTYKGENILSDGIGKLKNIQGVGEAIDIIQPFTKTPANIGLMVVQHDPLIGNAIAAIQAIKGDNLAAMDSASRAATGTAIMAIGFALRALGWTTGGEDDDKDKAAMDKATGNAAYSFGGKYSYDWAEPGGSMLAFGSDLYDTLVNNKEDGFGQAILKSIFAKGDAFFNMGLMQGISNVLDSNYGSTTETLITNSIESLFSQFVPSIVSRTASALDSKNRATYDETNTVLENALNKARAGLPGNFFGIGRETLAESPNVKGESETRGNLAERLAENFILPGQRNHGEMSDADAYIYDLYERTGNKTIFPEKAPYSVELNGESVDMTAEDRATYQKTLANTYYSTLNDLYDNGTLDNMSDDVAIKLFSEIRSYASDTAKAELAESKGLPYESDLQNLIKGEEKIGEDMTALDKENIPTYFATKQLLNTSIKNKDYDTLDELVKAYSGYDDNLKTVIDERLANFKQFRRAQQNGINAKSWLTYKDSLKNVQKLEDTQSDGSRLKYKAIVDSGLTKIEQQKLIDMDDEISKNWKMADEVLSNEGFSKKEIYEFFSNADWTYSEKTDEYQANGQLGAYEAYVALQKMIPDDEAKRKRIFNAFVEATGEAGRYDGWSRDTGYNKWTKYTYDFCKKQIAKYGDTSYGSWNKDNPQMTTSTTSTGNTFLDRIRKGNT